jgi:protein-export membrane protein SecD
MKSIKIRIIALLILIISAGIGYFVYQGEMSGKKPFKLGLDLSGGASLTYRADLSQVASTDTAESLSSLRSILEDRVNTFGIAEPVVTTQSALTGSGRESRVNIQLPGVKDLDAAIKMIGETPVLEFRTENPNFNPDAAKNLTITQDMITNGTIDLSKALVNLDPYTSTSLTGRYLSRAMLQFDPQTRQPSISLQFDTEGSKLFEEITAENIGKTVAIYLDGKPLSTPRVNEAISGGQAVITGDFTPDEAKALVTRLNSGALPVPIELVSTEAVGPTLGAAAVHAGVMAGLIALLLISILLVIWYRLPGITAVISLGVYSIVMLAIFKYLPITLTSAGDSPIVSHSDEGIDIGEDDDVKAPSKPFSIPISQAKPSHPFTNPKTDTEIAKAEREYNAVQEDMKFFYRLVNSNGKYTATELNEFLAYRRHTREIGEAKETENKAIDLHMVKKERKATEITHSALVSIPDVVKSQADIAFGQLNAMSIGVVIMGDNRKTSKTCSWFFSSSFYGYTSRTYSNYRKTYYENSRYR